MKTPIFSLALLTLLTGALFAQEVEKLSEPQTLLFIRTVPEGARVLIDGKPAGTTDDLFRVEPGVRRIVIELDGCTPQSKELTVRAGQITRLVLQLKQQSGPVVEQDHASTARIKELVEDFFRHNYRDITTRETIEWGDFVEHEDGSSSIRYKCLATIWDKDIEILDKVFTFDANGKFLSVRNVGGTRPDRSATGIPPGWKVVQRVEVPADQTAAIGKRLGGRIEKLSNDIYLAHSVRVQINVMKCATAEDAAKIHASVLKMKGDPAYCLLMDKTVVEFVGQFDVDFAKRAAHELLGVGPHVSDDTRVPLTVEQEDRVRAQTLLSIKRNTQAAIQIYELDYGKYPALRDGWAELTQADGDKGPFLKGEPMNPFTDGSTVAGDDSGDWQYDADTHELRAVVPLEKEKADLLGLTSKDVVLMGEGYERTDSKTRAKEVAMSYFDSLMRGDAKKAASLSAVPFSFDRKRTVNTLDELEKLYQEIADTKGSRKVTPSRVIAFQGGDDPNITVMIWIEDESTSIFVKPGKEYRVVGFSD